MKSQFCLGIAAAALAITLQASPASAFWGLFDSGTSCGDSWSKWKIAADPAGYALWRATCFDAAGTGGSGEDLNPRGSAMRKGAGYDSDPSKGFGSDIPVTLPPDHPRLGGGRNTGISISRGTPMPVNVLAPRRPVIR